jgi:hypothetical protein
MFFSSKRVEIYDRENLHFCIAHQRVVKAHCLAIHQDRVHLRMRDAARLNYIFYRGSFA